MQVNTLSAPSAPATFRTVQPLLRIWQVGQALHALVVARQSDTQVQLRIGTTEVQAETPLLVRSGDRLRLEVVSNDGPVVLRLINESPREAVVAAAMRSALPCQGPLSPLLANLAVLCQDSEPRLPAELARLS